MIHLAEKHICLSIYGHALEWTHTKITYFQYLNLLNLLNLFQREVGFIQIFILENHPLQKTSLNPP